MSNGENNKLDFSELLGQLGKRLFSDLCSWGLLGWKYSAHIDHNFLLNSLPEKHEKHENYTEHKIDADFLTPACENDTVTDRAGAVLAALLSEACLTKRWALLDRYLGANINGLLEDDSLAGESEKLPDFVARNTSPDCLNILIIGAGPIGLAVANRLKLRLRKQVNVLVLDHRTQAPHQKRPYDRKWPLHVNNSIIEGVFDPRIEKLLKDFGTKGCVGANLASLEALLFWSNRALGVKFFFEVGCALVFLKHAQVDLVIDATGGRFDYGGQGVEPVPDNEKIKAIKVPLRDNEGLQSAYRKFGISQINRNHASAITFSISQHLAYPVVEGKRIQTAMFKFINIPIDLHQPVLDFVTAQNDDSLFYVWPNLLHKDINKLLVLVNLDLAGFEHMRACCDQSQTLKDFRASLRRHSATGLDARILKLFDLVASLGAQDDAIVEPPFCYAPYVRSDLAHVRRCYDRPIFAVGDALFNGHPKVGNGLAAHLVVSKIIVDAVVDYYLKTVTVEKH